MDNGMAGWQALYTWIPALLLVGLIIFAYELRLMIVRKLQAPQKAMESAKRIAERKWRVADVYTEARPGSHGPGMLLEAVEGHFREVVFLPHGHPDTNEVEYMITGDRLCITASQKFAYGPKDDLGSYLRVRRLS